MAVFRIDKNKNYTVMSNYHLRDRNLSCKACGLLSKMLSLPEEWDYTTRGLASLCKDGVDSIGSALKELEQRGQQEGFGVAHSGGVFANAFKHLLDMFGGDLPEAVLNIPGGVFCVPANLDRRTPVHADLQHQLHQLVQLRPVLGIGQNVILDPLSDRLPFLPSVIHSVRSENLAAFASGGGKERGRKERIYTGRGRN